MGVEMSTLFIELMIMQLAGEVSIFFVHILFQRYIFCDFLFSWRLASKVFFPVNIDFNCKKNNNLSHKKSNIVLWVFLFNSLECVKSFSDVKFLYVISFIKFFGIIKYYFLQLKFKIYDFLLLYS